MKIKAERPLLGNVKGHVFEPFLTGNLAKKREYPSTPHATRGPEPRPQERQLVSGEESIILTRNKEKMVVFFAFNT
jgi:hypothetical protein